MHKLVEVRCLVGTLSHLCWIICSLVVPGSKLQSGKLCCIGVSLDDYAVLGSVTIDKRVTLMEDFRYIRPALSGSNCRY